MIERIDTPYLVLVLVPLAQGKNTSHYLRTEGILVSVILFRLDNIKLLYPDVFRSLVGDIVSSNGVFYRGSDTYRVLTRELLIDETGIMDPEIAGIIVRCIDDGELVYPGTMWSIINWPIINRYEFEIARN